MYDSHCSERLKTDFNFTVVGGGKSETNFIDCIFAHYSVAVFGGAERVKGGSHFENLPHSSGSKKSHSSISCCLEIGFGITPMLMNFFSMSFSAFSL